MFPSPIWQTDFVYISVEKRPRNHVESLIEAQLCSHVLFYVPFERRFCNENSLAKTADTRVWHPQQKLHVEILIET